MGLKLWFRINPLCRVLQSGIAIIGVIIVAKRVLFFAALWYIYAVTSRNQKNGVQDRDHCLFYN